MTVTIREVPYFNTSLIINARQSEAPRNTRADGYGSKIPTSWELQLTDKKWRRIYCVCWSNAGTRYVIHNGEPRYLSTTFDPSEYVDSEVKP